MISEELTPGAKTSPKIETRHYPVENTDITVQAKEFLPSKETVNPEDAVVLIQGWGPGIDAPSYDELASSLANNFGRRVFMLHMQPDKNIPDSLNHEAIAAYRFLDDHHVENLIAIGYSQGGATAVDLAVHCQNQGSIRPETVILLAPVGLNDQNPIRLVSTFGMDTLEATPNYLRTKPVSPLDHSRAEKAGIMAGMTLDVTKGTVDEVIARKGIGYPARLGRQLTDMSEINPRMQELQTPVILIQGKHDRPAGPRGDLTSGQMSRQDPDQNVTKALHDLFPQSPKVMRLLAERDSHHQFPLI